MLDLKLRQLELDESLHCDNRGHGGIGVEQNLNLV